MHPQQRLQVLDDLSRRGVCASAVWLRFLNEQGLVFGEPALRAIAQAHGVDPDALVARWGRAMAAWLEAGGRRLSADDIALATVRDGPRIALMVIPAPAFAAAVAGYGEGAGDATPSAST